MVKILREDPDSLIIGFLFGSGCKFRFDGRFNQTLITICQCRSYEFAAFAVSFDAQTVQVLHASLVVRRNTHLQDTFRLSASQSQQTMRRASLQRFAEIKIITVFCPFLLFTFHHFGTDDGSTAELLAHGVPTTFVLVELFGQNIRSPGQSLVRILYLPVHITSGHFAYVRLTLHGDNYGQGFQSFLPGYLGTRTTFRFIRQIDVFQFRSVPTSLDSPFQFIGQLVLCPDGSQYRFLSFARLDQFVIHSFDFSDLHFIQPSGHLLTVTADKRDGSPSLQ